MLNPDKFTYVRCSKHLRETEYKCTCEALIKV